MSDKKQPRSFGTHDGQFHADEVTACALMLLFNLIDEDKVVRTRDKSILDKCEYVCDVGGEYDPKRKLFDHHQVSYDGQLSGAGMILLYLRDTDVINQYEYRLFKNSLIDGVDAHDNGRHQQVSGVSTYSNVISNFAPIAYDATPAEQDEAFFVALKFSLSHLDRLWKRYQYTASCKEKVAEAMQQGKDFLIFDKSVPWLIPFFELEGVKHPAKFVVIPSGNHWNLRGIPPSFEDRMNVRHPLPKEWAGLLDKELKEVTGIDGAIFCHKGRFISVWETKEDALTALDYVLKQPKELENAEFPIRTKHNRIARCGCPKKTI